MKSFCPEFAHLACLSGSQWATRSDYNACVPLQLSDEGEEVSSHEDDFYDYCQHLNQQPNIVSLQSFEIGVASMLASLCKIHISGTPKDP